MADKSTQVTNDDSADVRVLIDADGERRLVREVGSPRYDRRERALIFMADGAMRRVRDYPSNWRQCSDDELIAIRHRR